MKVKWLGHAAVELVSASGLKILFDPYVVGFEPGPEGRLSHAPITEPYDIVAVTHEHPDHNNIGMIRGNPEIVRGMEIRGKGTVTVKGIDFWSIGTFHDDKGGILGGENSILCCNVDGVNIAHSGDIGHVPTKKQLDELKKHGVDVLLLCIPIHYRNAKCDFRFITVDEFCKGKADVKYHYLSEMNFYPFRRPGPATIVVLQPDL
jgi:L-ascorbate metabolism protein UlaG (beta-lactamase superfamily)